MQNNYPQHVFVSYSRKDTESMQNIVAFLKNRGIKVWLDNERLAIGTRAWEEEIEKAISTSTAILVILSPESKRSAWVRREITYSERYNKTIFPILVRGDESQSIPISLINYQFLDLRDNIETGLDRLCSRLLKDKEELEKPIAFNASANQNTDIGLPQLKNSASSEVVTIVNTQPAQVTSQQTTIDRLTIIVPLYNEAHMMDELVRGLRAENLIDQYKVILCDDGSTDNTFEVMKKCERGTKNLRCIQNKFNERKVGAIYNMANVAQTKFVLTLDADCVLSELTSDALDRLMDKMDIENIAATCFRITPNERGLLSKLQKIDYTIFTDSIRRILGVPVCLIGQGVLWKTESLLTVLSYHSGAFDGDDLENTVIALQQGMNIYWEDQTILLKTEPKRTLLGLIKQRALSWDFGMFRVLFKKRALSLGGNSGAFYKNLLLLDFFAHPLKVIAIPLLFSVPIVNFMGFSFYENGFSSIYREAIFISFKFGSYGVIGIWLMTVVNAFVCVRGYLPSVMKWSIFSAAYLSSPFVYTLYYPLLYTPYINAYDVLGASIHWLGEGLIFTYIWWVLLTYFLILVSSLDLRAKVDLALVAFLSPMYYFLLLVVSRTIAIIKYLSTLLGRQLHL